MQLFELVGGDGIDQCLELEPVYAKGLHLPAGRTSGCVSENDVDLIPRGKKSAANFEKQRPAPGTGMPLGVPARGYAAVSGGRDGAVIGRGGIIELWGAEIANAVKRDFQVTRVVYWMPGGVSEFYGGERARNDRLVWLNDRSSKVK